MREPAAKSSLAFNEPFSTRTFCKPLILPDVGLLPGPPPNKINGLTDIVAAVATVVGDRFYTLRKLALPALVRFRGDADMTGALNRLDLSKVTPRRHRRLKIAAMKLGFCNLRRPICTARRRAGVSRLVRNRRRAPQPPIAWAVRHRRRAEPKDNRRPRTGRGQGITGCHPRCRRR